MNDTPTSSPPLWRKPLRRFLKNWRLRHQHPFNFAIHLIGIPLAFWGVYLLVQAEWLWGGAAFVIGYLLQYVGHLVEGNDLGEWAAIKSLLGMPYVSISPRWQGADSDQAP